MIIKKGTTRIAFIFKNWTIKVPRIKNDFYGRIYNFIVGCRHNRFEYIWSKSNIYKFLCPVIFSFLGSLVIIMPTVKELSNKEFKKLTKYNFSYEHKKDSYGRLENNIVVIDYGN